MMTNFGAPEIAAYLNRIEYDGSLEVSAETLRRLHTAHAFHIPFENLDIHLGKPISLELDDVFDKIVVRRRGGYCYEMNGLFAAVLETLGFEVRRLSGRIMFGYSEMRPRSHQLSLVTVDGERWLCDVSYGSRGLIEPIILATERPTHQFNETFRLVEDKAYGYILQSEIDSQWQNQVGFTLEAQYPVDYRLPNYWNSTSPDSKFVQSRMVTMPTPEGRLSLLNWELKVRRNGEMWAQTAVDEDDYRRMLRDYFGLMIDEVFVLPIAVTGA